MSGKLPEQEKKKIANNLLITLPRDIKLAFGNDFAAYRDGKVSEEDAVTLLVNITRALKPYSALIFDKQPENLTASDVANFLNPKNKNNWETISMATFPAANTHMDRTLRDPIYRVIDDVVFGKKGNTFKMSESIYSPYINDGFSSNVIETLDKSKKFVNFDSFREKFKSAYSSGEITPTANINAFLSVFNEKNLPKELKKYALSEDMPLSQFIKNSYQLNRTLHYTNALPSEVAVFEKFNNTGYQNYYNSWSQIKDFSEKYKNANVSDLVMYLEINNNKFSSRDVNLTNDLGNKTKVDNKQTILAFSVNDQVKMFQESLGLKDANADGKLGAKTALLAISKGLGGQLSHILGVDESKLEQAAVNKDQNFFKKLSSKGNFDEIMLAEMPKLTSALNKDREEAVAQNKADATNRNKSFERV